MSTYWAILEKVKGSTLRLTKMDDEIYEHLLKDFPEFDPAKTINEDEMKSKAGKERWRKFMMAYEKKIDDYNFGTMMRSNPKWEYGRDETIFVPRMQFYAIEIARYDLPPLRGTGFEVAASCCRRIASSSRTLLTGPSETARA
jgi:hypothetical protein